LNTTIQKQTYDTFKIIHQHYSLSFAYSFGQGTNMRAGTFEYTSDRLLEADIRPDIEFQPVRSGEPVTIDTEVPMSYWGAFGIVAEIQLGDENDTLLVLKVEDIPPDPDGHKYPFGINGPQLSADARLIAVNRRMLQRRMDREDFVDGEVAEIEESWPTTFGRQHHVGSMSHSAYVSKTHVGLSLDRDGYLKIEDHDSAKGTYLKALPESLRAGERHLRTEKEAAYAGRMAREGFERDQRARLEASRLRAAQEQADRAAADARAEQAVRAAAEARRQAAQAAQEAFLRGKAKRDADDLARRQAAQAQANKDRHTNPRPPRVEIAWSDTDRIRAEAEAALAEYLQKQDRLRAEEDARRQAAQAAENQARLAAEAKTRKEREEYMKSGATEEANRARKAEREATDKRYLDTIVDEKLKESILTVRPHAITMPIEKIGQLIKRIGEMRTTHKSALDIYRALAREFHPDRPKTASEELMQLLSLIYDTKEKKFWHDRQSESAAA
jgi:hypothetical protein